MTDFLQFPQTPERDIKSALIGDNNDIFVDYLHRFGIETIVLPKNEAIEPAITNHADTQVFHAGAGVFFAAEAPCALLRKTLLQATVTPVIVQGAYPGDSALNALQIGQTWFANTKTIAPALTAYANRSGIHLIHVNQGYANCSAVAISNTAVLTDDASIAGAAAAAGLDVLQLAKGDVQLPGHAYGFIGGACAMIGPQRLIFFGDVSKHRDSERIRAFLAKHHCRFACLPGVPLTDIGGIVAVR